MKFKFTKMHALGNDYIIIDGFQYKSLLKNAAKLSIGMSDRHFGAGGDGIIFVLPGARGTDLTMRMFNADGSEAEMCGNGIRQLALFSWQNRLVKKTDITVNTLAGVRHIRMKKNGKKISGITVDMGAPILDPGKIPVRAQAVPGGYSTVNIDVADRNFDFTLVSMGNPHAVAFTAGVREMDVERYGKPVENNTQIFPKRTNVEFIEVLSRSEIRMRVWERGSGETLACGTGACASVAAAVLNGLTDRKVRVHLLGGDLLVEWAKDGKIYMTGNAVRVYEGIADSADF